MKSTKFNTALHDRKIRLRLFSRKKGVWMGSQKEAEVRKVRRKDSDSDMKLYM